MAVLFAESTTLLVDWQDDFDLLFQALKPGGRVVLYTEDAQWSADFAQSLVGVFGVGVSVAEIPSAEAPPSRHLQRYPVTYVVTGMKKSSV